LAPAGPPRGAVTVDPDWCYAPATLPDGLPRAPVEKFSPQPRTGLRLACRRRSFRPSFCMAPLVVPSPNAAPLSPTSASSSSDGATRPAGAFPFRRPATFWWGRHGGMPGPPRACPIFGPSFTGRAWSQPLRRASVDARRWRGPLGPNCWARSPGLRSDKHRDVSNSRPMGPFRRRPPAVYSRPQPPAGSRILVLAKGTLRWPAAEASKGPEKGPEGRRAAPSSLKPIAKGPRAASPRRCPDDRGPNAVPTKPLTARLLRLARSYAALSDREAAQWFGYPLCGQLTDAVLTEADGKSTGRSEAATPTPRSGPACELPPPWGGGSTAGCRRGGNGRPKPFRVGRCWPAPDGKNLLKAARRDSTGTKG